LENNPLKHKVNRDKAGASDTSKTTDTKNTETDELKRRLKELEAENKTLKSKADNRSESLHFGPDNQFNGVEPALKAYLPPKVYENVRQILYGTKCD
jgi:predicted nuclease with TOPRIM domain